MALFGFAAKSRPQQLAALPVALRYWLYATLAVCLLPLLLQLPKTLALQIGGAFVLVALLSWRLTLPAALRVIIALALGGFIFVGSQMSIGRDTGCALLAAMLAIKPAETQTPRDARALVLFALFAPFATFLLDQGPLSLLLGLAGVVLALLSVLRLAEMDSQLPPQPIRLAGRGVGRLLLLGLPLVLVSFWLFPRLGAPLWGIPERAMARTGLSDSMAPGDFVDLMADDTPALRAHFNGTPPPRDALYWRGPVLWNYDGRIWSTSDSLRRQPVQPGQYQPQAQRWNYLLELEATESRLVVALDIPDSVPNQLQLSSEYLLYHSTRLTQVSRWQLSAAPAAQLDATLSPAMRAAALQLPDGFNPRTRQWAAQLRARYGTNDMALINAVLAQFHREYRYTLTTPLLGRNAVDEFLFDEKAGFCEHYAGAFTFLLRSAGIPTRVVTGYLGGYRNPFGDYYLITRADAHAWTEVWLQGRGWVRFDPTAAVAPERIMETLADRRQAAGGLAALDTLAQTVDFADWMRRTWNDWVLGFDLSRQQSLLRPFGLEKLDSLRLGLLFVLAALLAIALMLWFTLRQQQQRDPLLLAWQQMGRRYQKWALARQLHEPAGDWLARVQRKRGSAASTAELAGLVARFVQLRYSAQNDTGADKKALIKALRRHRPRMN